jgi:hypothetical protein
MVEICKLLKLYHYPILEEMSFILAYSVRGLLLKKCYYRLPPAGIKLRMERPEQTGRFAHVANAMSRDC